MRYCKVGDPLLHHFCENAHQAHGVCRQVRLEQMLHVRDLQREVNDRVILTNISFSLNRGDILFVRGPSGVGKSLLLRALAYLDPVQVAFGTSI